MGTPEKTKAMNAAARKWDELWEAIQGMENPEKIYVLSRISADTSIAKPVNHREAPQRTAED